MGVICLPCCFLVRLITTILPYTCVSNLVWTKKRSYLLGLLAKIKCIICSYQLNIWYSALCTDDINAISHWGDGSPGQPGPFTHVALELHNIQEWHTLFFNKTKTNTHKGNIPYIPYIHSGYRCDSGLLKTEVGASLSMSEASKHFTRKLAPVILYHYHLTEYSLQGSL